MVVVVCVGRSAQSTPRVVRAPPRAQSALAFAHPLLYRHGGEAAAVGYSPVALLLRDAASSARSHRAASPSSPVAFARRL